MLTASQLNEIKARVNAEMSRRSYYGSLAGYSNQFSNYPTAGKTIYAEQGDKLIRGLLNIRDLGNLNLNDLKSNGIIPRDFDYNTIKNALATYESESITGNKSSCRGACTGLCVGTCGSTCTGCQNACGFTCEGTCSVVCGSSCGSCSSNCTGGCYSGCSTGCKNGCTGSSY